MPRADIARRREETWVDEYRGVPNTEAFGQRKRTKQNVEWLLRDADYRALRNAQKVVGSNIRDVASSRSLLATLMK